MTFSPKRKPTRVYVNPTPSPERDYLELVPGPRTGRGRSLRPLRPTDDERETIKSHRTNSAELE